MTQLLSTFKVFGWQDLIDIAVIALIIYQLLMLIKGTRAVQLIKGLFVLLVASVIAEEIGLTTLNWLLDKI